MMLPGATKDSLKALPKFKYNGRVTAAVFIEFLGRLLVNASKPIVLIVDGHPTHRAKSVAKFVAEQAGMIELVLPAALFTGTEPERVRLE